MLVSERDQKRRPHIPIIKVLILILLDVSLGAQLTAHKPQEPFVLILILLDVSLGELRSRIFRDPAKQGLNPYSTGC